MLTSGAKTRAPTRRVQKLATIPAPIGGLNARDSYASMPATDAIALVNWLSDTGGVRCRKGYVEWAIDFPSSNEVQSVFGYFAPGTNFSTAEFVPQPSSVPGKLFAATKAAIYEITTSTNAPTSSQALSGSTYAGWISHTQLTNSAGTYLLVCSETDGYYYYNGATWAAGGTTGLASADAAYLMVWKRRIWLVEQDSTSAWYLPANAITGAAVEFDFGPVFKTGGKLEYLASWTIDAGEGIDDFLVAVSTLGDVAVYKGTDPASAATFALVGTWQVGPIPAGRRGFTQYGGDLLILSSQGVFPLSYITRGGAGFLQATGKEYTSKIRAAIGKDLQYSFALRGWQLMDHPNERILIANVPNYSQSTSRQYVMSTVLNEWATYQDVPIYSLGKHAGYAFAGTRTGKVLLITTGAVDNVAYGTTTGDPIRGIIIPAFSTFDLPAAQKHMKMVRCNFLSDESPAVDVNVNVNYSLRSPTTTPTPGANINSLWDSATWDSSVWGGDIRPYSLWAGVNGMGFSAAATIVVESTGDSILTSIDYIYEPGGPL